MPTISYATTAPAAAEADVLVLPVFEGPTNGPGVREVRGIDLLEHYRGAGLKGKPGESLLVPNAGISGLAAKSVLLVGLGPKDEVTTDTLRRAVGRAAPQLSRHASVATTLPLAAGRTPEDAVQATVEGLLLGGDRFDRYKSGANGDVPQPPAPAAGAGLGGSRGD